jgi:hypothetical protein
LAEQLICNQQVVGSIPTGGFGGMAAGLPAKPHKLRYEGSIPSPAIFFGDHNVHFYFNRSGTDNYMYHSIAC